MYMQLSITIYFYFCKDCRLFQGYMGFHPVALIKFIHSFTLSLCRFSLPLSLSLALVFFLFLPTGLPKFNEPWRPHALVNL